MIMHWPQIIFLSLLCIETGIHLAKNGQPRGNYSFGIRLFDDALLIIILYYGGFFLGVSP